MSCQKLPNLLRNNLKARRGQHGVMMSWHHDFCGGRGQVVAPAQVFGVAGVVDTHADPRVGGALVFGDNEQRGDVDKRASVATVASPIKVISGRYMPVAWWISLWRRTAVMESMPRCERDCWGSMGPYMAVRISVMVSVVVVEFI